MKRGEIRRIAFPQARDSALSDNLNGPGDEKQTGLEVWVHPDSDSGIWLTPIGSKSDAAKCRLVVPQDEETLREFPELSTLPPTSSPEIRDW